MTDDVVARLRNWVTDWNGAEMVRGKPPRDGIHCDVLYDAIVEIIALRRTILLGPDLPALARAQALEEAARVAHANGFGETAAAIRELKRKH